MTWKLAGGGLPLLLMLSILLISTSQAQPPTPPPIPDAVIEAEETKPAHAGNGNEKDDWDMAFQLWQGEAYELAAQWLKKFTEDYPDSKWAAEAAYKHGAAYLIRGKTKEAKAAFDELIGKHFDSPWSKLALISHYDQKSMFALAKNLRAEARKSKNTSRAETAVKLLQLYVSRFPKATEKEELFYLIGDCFRLSGKELQYKAAMQQVLLSDANGGWGMLAKLHLGDIATFRQNMERLISTDVGDGENRALFLELANRFEAKLDGEDRIRCRFCKARCYEEKQRELDIYAGILRDHPKSKWAAESAFWLAENQFRNRKLAGARKSFAQLAKNYPKSPRGKEAKQYARWIDMQGQTGNELEQALRKFCKDISQKAPTVSFHAQGFSQKTKDHLELRFAWQGPKRFFFKVQYGKAGFLLAANRQGTWYHPVDGETCYHVKTAMPLPLPHVKFVADPATEQVSFKGNFVSSEDKAFPSIVIAPAVIPLTVKHVLTWTHATHQIRTSPNGRKHTVFIMQHPGWNHKQTRKVEVEVDQTGSIRAMRLYGDKDDAKSLQLCIDKIVIGEELPHSAFDVSLPADVPVHTVKNINALEVYAQVMRLASVLQQELPADINSER